MRKRPQHEQVESIFRTKRQLETIVKRIEATLQPAAFNIVYTDLETSQAVDKTSLQDRTKLLEERKLRAEQQQELQRILEFPRINVSKQQPMEPMIGSLLELYKFAHGRAVSLCVPTTIVVPKTGEDCCTLYSDSQGWLLTEPSFSNKNLIDALKTFFDDSVSLAGEEQQFVLKTYEAQSNTNLTVLYNNKYIMLEEAKKLIGNEAVLLQKYVVPLNKRPQLYRVDIARNNSIRVYTLKLKEEEDQSEDYLGDKHTSYRKLSRIDEKFGHILNIKQDLTMKHCVSSLYCWNIKAQRMVGSKVPEIEKEVQNLKELYERYVFVPRGCRITRFVVDLLPGNDGKLYFLQVKHYESEKRFISDASHLRKIKINKGLDVTEKPCMGRFCGKAAGSFALQELVMYLMVDGYLSKNWVRTGVYLVSTKLLSDYDAELQKYEFLYQTNQRCRQETGRTNVLAPLLAVEYPPAAAERRVVSLRSSYESLPDVDSEYDPKHVCELCNRVYKLYKNKKQMLLQCNVQLCGSLGRLREKDLALWTSEDVKFLLEIYGHTLPPIQRSLTPRAPKRGRIKCRDYHFGYQTILESKMAEAKAKTKSVAGGGKKNYLEENIRIVYNKGRGIKKAEPEKSIHILISKIEEAQIMNKRCVSLPRVTIPQDILEKYRDAERSQRRLVKRLRASIERGYCCYLFYQEWKR